LRLAPENRKRQFPVGCPGEVAANNPLEVCAYLPRFRRSASYFAGHWLMEIDAVNVWGLVVLLFLTKTQTDSFLRTMGVKKEIIIETR